MTKTEEVSKGLLMTALICGTLVVGVNPAGAAEPGDDLQGFTLEQIVVTANRTSEKILDTPPAFQLLPQKIWRIRGLNILMMH